MTYANDEDFKNLTFVDNLAKLRQAQVTARDIVRHNQQHATAKSKENYDKCHKVQCPTYSTSSMTESG